MNDTIFALSSGRLPAAIAVARISGPGAGAALATLAGRMPKPRQAALVTLRWPGSGEPIDQALVLWFPGPASETGEDVAELQVHGSRAVVAALMQALGALVGLRPAEAGEFTRRALENGKLDLTAVEGLADLIGSETEAQRRQALHQLAGALGRRAEGWRDLLVRALALVESALDFSDEGDVPAGTAAQAQEMAGRLAAEIGAVLADRRGERLREGLTLAIAGPPNAGKSSLFNWLAGREAAIVSPYPGTTRDVLELHMDLAGYPVVVLDTAGLRASDDPVEQEGIRRARARAADADLTLWVEDLVAGGEAPPDHEGPVWRVKNKADLVDSLPQRMEANGGASTRNGIARCFVVSVKTGWGLDALFRALASFAAETLQGGEPALVTRERQRHALSQARDGLRRAAQLADGREEMLAEELRLAARALERLLGRVDVEEVLEVIFRDFCIGK